MTSPTPDATSVRALLRKAWSRAREAGPAIGIELSANFVLPFLTYEIVRPALGDVRALMAASAPPLLWTAIEFARKRRIDALSVLVLAGILLSLLAFVGGGDVHLLQLREQLVAVVIGFVFLASAALGRPLIYQLARARLRRQGLSRGESFEQLRDNPIFRRAMMRMTVVWGVALWAEAALSCALVFRLTITHYLLVAPIVGYSAIGGVTAWTFWYAKREIERARQTSAPSR